MTFPLTPERLAVLYDCLRVMPPFKGWRLPPSHLVEFRTPNRRDLLGEYIESDPPRIMVSRALNGTFDNVLEVLAHEMVHMAQHQSGCSNRANHNRDFLRRAKAVCRVFGWDLKRF